MSNRSSHVWDALTPLERLLINAIQVQWTPGQTVDQRNKAYADAMANIWLHHPYHDDTGCLYASSLVTLGSPGDYGYRRSLQLIPSVQLPRALPLSVLYVERLGLLVITDM
jgi:hypothetical protein